MRNLQIKKNFFFQDLEFAAHSGLRFYFLKDSIKQNENNMKILYVAEI